MGVVGLVVVASLAAAATGFAQTPVNAKAQAMVEFKGRVGGSIIIVDFILDVF